jgi:type III restriction enzyme
MARSTEAGRANAATPILNGPYDEPAFHYATSTDGNLDYEDRRPGRRIFAPETPQVPLGKQPQPGMFDLNDFVAQYRNHIVNKLRDQVGAWRRDGYPGVTSRVTRDLLQYWFSNPGRPAWQQLFYAQREAVETAIWLNEVADKSNPGTHALNLVRQANETVGDWGGGESSVLPRMAFKMATGTGKTVVMARRTRRQHRS